MRFEVSQRESLRPIPLVQVHEHALFQLRFPVVDRNRVIMPVQAVDKGLNGGLVDVSDIRCSLAWLLPSNNSLWLNKTESVDNDLSFHGLDWVNDNGD